jgi:thioredoxin-dependent peroxiredoxin
MRLSPKLLTFGLALGIVAMPALASAQQAAAPAGPNRTGDPKNALAIGSMAPDFELPGSTRYGPLAKPIHLSDFKGKTVVIAFFPKARTRGCTIQMRSYRDDYENLFDAGRDVVLIGISTDTVEEQWTWARDEQFQFVFGADPEGKVVKQFGATREAAGAARFLYVIDPAGKVAFHATPFVETDPVSYETLAAEVSKVITHTTAAAAGN